MLQVYKTMLFMPDLCHKIHHSSVPLHNMFSLWPFTVSGMAAIRMLNSRFKCIVITITIGYITKWVEEPSFITSIKNKILRFCSTKSLLIPVHHQ